MITPPLVMIDLDHSFDRTTQTITDPQAAEIVQSLNSYTELSPSGTGLHILTYGQLPGKGIHTAIEMYGQDRFTTITTNHLTGTPPTIENTRQEALDALYHRFAPPVREPSIRTQGGVFGAGRHLPNCHRKRNMTQCYNGSCPVILQAMPSPSNADFVLIMKLLHWTGDNVELDQEHFFVLSTWTAREGTAQNRTDHLC